MTPAPTATHAEEAPVETRPGQPEVLPSPPRSTETSPRQPTVLEPPRSGEPHPGPDGSPGTGKTRARPELFYESLLDFSSTRPRRATREFFASLFTHVLILAVLLLIPLCFTQSIDLTQFTRMQLVAPPPPPPPPPPPAPMAERVRPLPKRVLITGGKLLAPTVIPEAVTMLHEKPLPPEIDATAGGMAGGVPGGVPGGQLGGVLGSILTGGQQSYLPKIAPPPPKPMVPVRVGGRVKEPRKIYAPAPVYPVLAKQARVEGTVVIEAIIDASGNVVEAKVVSGPALLMQAALAAVQQWKFEPTYLNEQPVPVDLVVRLEFHLNQ
jgi:periplasmic protein TonB